MQLCCVSLDFSCSFFTCFTSSMNSFLFIGEFYYNRNGDIILAFKLTYSYHPAPSFIWCPSFLSSFFRWFLDFFRCFVTYFGWLHLPLPCFVAPNPFFGVLSPFSLLLSFYCCFIIFFRCSSSFFVALLPASIPWSSSFFRFHWCSSLTVIYSFIFGC